MSAIASGCFTQPSSMVMNATGCVVGMWVSQGAGAAVGRVVGCGGGAAGNVGMRARMSRDSAESGGLGDAPPGEPPASPETGGGLPGAPGDDRAGAAAEGAPAEYGAADPVPPASAPTVITLMTAAGRRNHVAVAVARGRRGRGGRESTERA
jgi:hypothetical protein